MGQLISDRQTMKVFLAALLVLVAITFTAEGTSLCICENPFDKEGSTVPAYIGNPDITCKEENQCYVPCDADCQDIKPAKGRGRCVSSVACDGGLLFDLPSK